jgi:hypothetical protein
VELNKQKVPPITILRLARYHWTAQLSHSALSSDTILTMVGNRRHNSSSIKQRCSTYRSYIAWPLGIGEQYRSDHPKSNIREDEKAVALMTKLLSSPERIKLKPASTNAELMLSCSVSDAASNEQLDVA